MLPAPRTLRDSSQHEPGRLECTHSSEVVVLYFLAMEGEHVSRTFLAPGDIIPDDTAHYSKMSADDVLQRF